MEFIGFTPKQETYVMNTTFKEGLYAVVGEGPAKRMEKLGLEQQIRAYATALKEGGVSTFEITARYENWLEALKYIPDGVIKAVGTHANILTLWQAIKAGVILNVAAHGLHKLPGIRAIDDEQIKLMHEFEMYVREHLGIFEDILKLCRYEKNILYENPLTIDPIDFGNAHNAIVIPAGQTPTETYDLVARGAKRQKVYPWFMYTPEQWKDQFAAIPHVYKKRLSLCPTGGVRENNLEATLQLPYVDTAGTSDLIQETPEKSLEKAKIMREIVDRVKGKKASG